MKKCKIRDDNEKGKTIRRLRNADSQSIDQAIIHDDGSLKFCKNCYLRKIAAAENWLVLL